MGGGFNMTAEAVAPLPRGRRGFAPWHKWDRNFFLILLALIWCQIVFGFGSDMMRRAAAQAAPFPAIVHVHAVVFVAWLALLTTQIWLIRRGRAATHMKLGIAGMLLAPVMVVLGIAAAIQNDIAAAARHGVPMPPPDHPAFLAIQFSDVLAFAGLAGAAFLLRRNASAHKRLILLATLCLVNAGFARWLGPGIHALMGMGFWASMAALNLGPDVLVAGLGAYDLVTRGRLHPVYLPAAIWIVALQLIAQWLYFSPAWAPIAARLVGV
jgi:uncharacterized membrane protein YozB (DUF420 family)